MFPFFLYGGLSEEKKSNSSNYWHFTTELFYSVTEESELTKKPIYFKYLCKYIKIFAAFP